MSGQDAGPARALQSPGTPVPAAEEQPVAADYTETVVPGGARRSNFRMLLTFGSMQLVFGAVLAGYDARFQGLPPGRLIVAMAIAAATMTVYCIGSDDLQQLLWLHRPAALCAVRGGAGGCLVGRLRHDGRALQLGQRAGHELTGDVT